MVGVRLALRVLVDSRQAALEAATPAQRDQQRLRHGEDVHIVAQVNPGQTGEQFGVFEHFSKVFKDGQGEAVTIESQCAEFGQGGEQRQQQPQVFVVEFGKADVHGHNAVSVVLEIEGNVSDVTSGQRDSRQVNAVAGRFFLQCCLETAEKQKTLNRI